MTSALTVRTITPAEHLAFIGSQRSVSFLQTPAWGRVKSEWRHESIGWFRDARSAHSSTTGDARSAHSSTTDAHSSTTDGELVGAGLVLYRQLPKLRRYLAYLPEGPALDWSDPDLKSWLAPMADHLRAQQAFGIRMGPPVVTRRWDADVVKKGVADPDIRSLADLPPTERSQTGAAVVSQLRELGWREQQAEGGFTAGQPRFNFAIPLKGRFEDDVLAGMNQLWRRNIKKAAKAGVEVTRGGSGDLPAFHDLYTLTAERDHFTPRPLAYFRTMFDALGGEEPDRIRLYLARHEGDLVAATIRVKVGGHVWYSYGASSTDKREVRGSNAVQWEMVRDAIAEGADVYDLRGITDTLDPDDPHVGLIQFKVGTGGQAVEYAGEWDLPLSRVLYGAFDLYMSRRG